MTLPFMTAPSYSEWCLFWATGFALGFQLYQKMPPWFQRVWKTLMVISLLLTAIAAMLGAGHGCGAGARFPRMAETHMVDTSSKWRPLPQLFYIQPDAKEVTPTPALPPVSESADKLSVPSTNSGVVMSWSQETATTTGIRVQSQTWQTPGGNSYTITIDSSGSYTKQIMDASGKLIATMTANAGGMITNSHMAGMKSYPASQQPSRCMASCLSHHRSWVSPVQDSYCEKDTSNADGGFYGWVKQGDAWLPMRWPATNESTDRAPELIRLKEGENISLTEGKRSY